MFHGQQWPVFIVLQEESLLPPPSLWKVLFAHVFIDTWTPCAALVSAHRVSNSPPPCPLRPPYQSFEALLQHHILLMNKFKDLKICITEICNMSNHTTYEDNLWPKIFAPETSKLWSGQQLHRPIEVKPSCAGSCFVVSVWSCLFVHIAANRRRCLKIV